MRLNRSSPEPNDSKFAYLRKGNSNNSMSRNDNSIMKKADRFINCYSDMLKPARTRDVSPQVNLKHLLIKNNVSIRAKS